MSRVKKSAAIAAALVAFVGAWEGLSLKAYRDVVGVPTICYGETEGVKMGQKMTLAECKARFIKSLDKHAEEMEACLKSPHTLPDKVYVSCASLTDNICSGAFCKSSVARYANAGNLKQACHSIRLYNKGRVNGKLQVIKGLENRRKAEEKLCLEAV